MLASFCRGPHTAQSTIKAFSELLKAEDIEIVGERLGHAKYCCDPECLYHKSYWEKRVHAATRTVTVVIDRDGDAF